MFTITASVAAAKNGVHRRKVFWLGWTMADTWDDNEDLKSPLTMLLLLKNGTRGDERTEGAEIPPERGEDGGPAAERGRRTVLATRGCLHLS